MHLIRSPGNKQLCFDFIFISYLKKCLTYVVFLSIVETRINIMQGIRISKGLRQTLGIPSYLGSNLRLEEYFKKLSFLRTPANIL